VAGRRAHQNFNLQDFSIFCLEQAGDQIEITIVDPGFQKGRRNSQPDDALRYRVQFKPRKPAGINIRTDLGLQTCTDTLEQYVMLHVSLFPRRFKANRTERLLCIVPIIQCTRRPRNHLHSAAFHSLFL
jgi:hypothetical protein